jgi:hypothetical protein
MRNYAEPLRERAEIRHPVMMARHYTNSHIGGGGGPVTSGLLVTINPCPTNAENRAGS